MHRLPLSLCLCPWFCWLHSIAQKSAIDRGGPCWFSLTQIKRHSMLHALCHFFFFSKGIQCSMPFATFFLFSKDIQCSRPCATSFSMVLREGVKKKTVKKRSGKCEKFWIWVLTLVYDHIWLITNFTPKKPQTPPYPSSLRVHVKNLGFVKTSYPDLIKIH